MPSVPDLCASPPAMGLGVLFLLVPVCCFDGLVAILLCEVDIRFFVPRSFLDISYLILTRIIFKILIN